MEFKFFDDLIDALGQVVSGLKALAETLAGRPTGAVAAKDWDALLQQMRTIFATEGEIALFIGHQFRLVANDARRAMQNKRQSPFVHDTLATLRVSDVAERQELTKHEFSLREVV